MLCWRLGRNGKKLNTATNANTLAFFKSFLGREVLRHPPSRSCALSCLVCASLNAISHLPLHERSLRCPCARFEKVAFVISNRLRVTSLLAKPRNNLISLAHALFLCFMRLLRFSSAHISLNTSPMCWVQYLKLSAVNQVIAWPVQRGQGLSVMRESVRNSPRPDRQPLRPN